MLVCHPYKFIYLKMRKKAGTSVEMALRPLAMDDPEAEIVEFCEAFAGVRGVVGRRAITGPAPDSLNKTWGQHMAARKAKALWGQRLWRRYKKVTNVRNPFDRAVSYFHWRAVRWERAGLSSVPASFEGYSDQQVFDAFRSHLKTERWSDDSKITTLRGKPCVDVVIRYEAIEEDFRRLESDLGLNPGTLLLPHTKKTSTNRRGTCIADDYDEECVNIVRKRMAWVWDLHDYPAEPESRAA